MELLMSQRYVLPHIHTRPQISDTQRAHTLHHPLIPIDRVRSSKVPSRPFRLLALPAEIQSLVYAHYFGQWSVTLDYERYSMLRSRVRVQGVPSTNILLTSRHVCRAASEVRTRCFTGRLYLNSVFVLITLRKKTDFDWLKSHIRILHFSDSSVRPERWYRYYENFAGLQKLEIDFPKLVRLDEDCLDIEQILQGEKDGVLTANLENFRTSLIGELGRTIMVIVSQTYCLNERLLCEGWHGILLKLVKIQLSESCARVLERTHDPGVDTISKQQFRMMREA